MLEDPAVAPAADIGAALAEACRVVGRYRVMFCALRDWSAGGAGVCPAIDAAIIGEACE